MMIGDLEQALRAASGVADGCANQILDLLDFANSAENPGKCVRCYFAIYHGVAGESADKMLPLRRWVEQHVEIVARDDEEQELERLPVRLNESEDLEAFCERIMNEFHQDRVHQASFITLNFAFRASEQAA